jgi:hypothetical protein
VSITLRLKLWDFKKLNFLFVECLLFNRSLNTKKVNYVASVIPGTSLPVCKLPTLPVCNIRIVPVLFPHTNVTLRLCGRSFRIYCHTPPPPPPPVSSAIYTWASVSSLPYMLHSSQLYFRPEKSSNPFLPR